MTKITVMVQDDDPGMLDRQIRLLRDEMRGLDADVDFAPGPLAPEGAKGMDPQTLNTIIVAVSSSPVLIQLGRVLAAFVDRGRRKVVVQEGDRRLEIHGPLDETSKQAVESFFRQELE